MGLSNEERLKGFLQAMTLLRENLIALRDQQFDCDSARRAHKRLVEPLVKQLDRVLGRFLWHREADERYWILGAKEGALQDLLSPTSMHDFREDDVWRAKAEQGSIHWWTFEASADKYIERWCASPFSDANLDVARSVVAWWLAWKRVGTLRYYVDRYPDSLFPASIKHQLHALVGRLFALRSQLAATAHYGMDDWELVERAYMARIKYATHLLNEAAKEVNSKFVRGVEKDGSPKLPPSFRFSDHGLNIVIEAGKTPLPRVMEVLQELERKNYDRKPEPAEDKLDYDGIVGPRLRSKQELESFINDPTTPMDQAKIARDELAERFGLSIPLPEHRVDKLHKRARSGKRRKR